jgi:hypothetical protein
MEPNTYFVLICFVTKTFYCKYVLSRYILSKKFTSKTYKPETLWTIIKAEKLPILVTFLLIILGDFSYNFFSLCENQQKIMFFLLSLLKQKIWHYDHFLKHRI